MTTPENPPAFPRAITVSVQGDVYESQDGMTLRDYFIAHAPPVPSWFKVKTWDEEKPVPAPDISPSHVRMGIIHHQEDPLAHLCRWQWAYAEAQLAERAKRKDAT